MNIFAHVYFTYNSVSFIYFSAQYHKNASQAYPKLYFDNIVFAAAIDLDIMMEQVNS